MSQGTTDKPTKLASHVTATRGALALLERELIRLARPSWLYATRMGLLLVMAGILALFWAGTTMQGTTSFEERALMGNALFLVLHYTVLVLLLLIVPAVVGGAIAGERQGGTAEVLYTTPLRPLGMLVGLAGGRIASTFALTACAAPALACCVAVGGVTTAELVFSVIHIGVLLVWLSSLCIMISAYCRKTTRAVLWGWGAGIFAVTLAWIIEVLVREWFDIPGVAGGDAPILNMWINPAFWSFFAPETQQWLGDAYPSNSMGMGIAAVQSAVFLLLARHGMRGGLFQSASLLPWHRETRPARPTAPPPESMAPDHGIEPASVPEAGGSRAVEQLASAQHRAPSGKRVDDNYREFAPPEGNAILWRDRIAIHRSRMRIFRYILFAVSAGLCFLFGLATRGYGDGYPEMAAMTIFVISCMLIIGRMGPAFTSELAAARMEVLLSTPVGRHEVFRGHVLATLLRLRLPALTLLALCGGLFLCPNLDRSGWNTSADASDVRLAFLTLYPLGWVGICTLTLGISAIWSIHSHNTLVALILPVLSILLVLALPPLLLVVFSELLRIVSNRGMEDLMALHPFSPIFLPREANYHGSGAQWRLALSGLGTILSSATGLLLLYLAGRTFARRPSSKWLDRKA